MVVEKDFPQLSSCAVALGFFDGLHPGHQQVIKAAAESGLMPLVVSIGSEKRRAERLLTDADRDALLEQMGVQMLVVPEYSALCGMSGEAFFKDIIIDRLGAKKVCCGFNFRFGRGAACGAGELSVMCEKIGAECAVCPPVCADGVPVSSSILREYLVQGDMESYKNMLGRRYSYSMEVVSGNRVGRTLGFPTMNQVFPKYLKLPRFGVYASISHLPDGRAYPSVTNIGVKPTVGSDRPLSETWVPNYDGELYGLSPRVELISFMRPERKFTDLDELRATVLRDGEKAVEIIGKLPRID